MIDYGDRGPRDELVRQFHDIEALLYPEGDDPGDEEVVDDDTDDDDTDDEDLEDEDDELAEQEESRLYERLFQTLAEYADRLPRVRLSVCPFCSAPLKRAFDPWALDGPWWHSSVQVKFEEPAACEHFRVLLGALDLNGRVPEDAVSQVLPGPDVPFVVPTLLGLPGMKAVMGALALGTGDTAYPVAYFSDQPTRPNQLHQPWCREAFWYQDENGNSLWFTANDEFDFELRPYIDAGTLLWIDLDQPDGVAIASGEGCPFLDLPGDRERQQLVVGERDLIGLPSGVPANPFEE